MDPIEAWLAARILPTAAYERVRGAYLEELSPQLRTRRIRLDAGLSVLFESADTVLRHVHEVLRVEGVHTPGRIAWEVAEYAPLIPTSRALKVTAFVDGGAPEIARRWATALASEPGVLSLCIGGDRWEMGPIRPGADLDSPVCYLEMPAAELAPALATAGAGRVLLQARLGDARRQAILSPALLRGLLDDLSFNQGVPTRLERLAWADARPPAPLRRSHHVHAHG